MKIWPFSFRGGGGILFLGAGLAATVGWADQVLEPVAVEVDHGSISNNFTWAGWAQPRTEICFLPQGQIQISDFREFVIYPDPGHSLYGKGHAGAGISVGKNGIQVLEHSEGYFEPVLRWSGLIEKETPIAVVYKNRVPSLFVKGQMVAVGQASLWIVHPGNQQGGPEKERFTGTALGWQLFNQPLELSQVQKLAESAPVEKRPVARDGEDFEPGWTLPMMPRSQEAEGVDGSRAASPKENLDALEKSFLDPPPATAPWVYWYWISDQISKEGITQDLEAMKRVGIGAAAIGNIALSSVPSGSVKVLSKEWMECVQHAIREGARVGVDIGLFNCPGWSQAGGPWVPPEKSMRYLATTEVVVQGPKEFSEKLTNPGLADSASWVYAYPLTGSVEEAPVPLTFTAGEGAPNASLLTGADPAHPCILEGTSWIWKEVADVGAAAPGSVFFRRVFTLSSDRKVKAATLSMTADNEYVCWVNGVTVGSSTSWNEARPMDIAAQLKPGRNILAVSVKNLGSEPNPAGLVGKMKIEFTSGPPEELATDAKWKTAHEEAGGWNGESFDDSAWSPAMVLGPTGMGPWGPIRISALTLPGGDGPMRLRMTAPGLVSVQTLKIYPGLGGLTGLAELKAKDGQGKFRPVAKLRLDRPGNAMRANEGFLVQGPMVAAFPPLQATEFELEFTHAPAGAQIAAIQLLSSPRLDHYVEKQLGKMHFNPLPTDRTYLWPPPSEPATPDGIIQTSGMVDLSQKISADGMLRWSVPAGRWLILRVGLAQVGTRNAPASPEGEGWEIDKMSPEMVRWHLDQFVGLFLRGMKAVERRALKYVISDSYEMGSQNWSDRSTALFRERFGYDPLPWFPVLTGRLVGSADQSERFLWDLRRFVADEIAGGFVGGLQSACQTNGLQLWLENYGHCGFPGEFLQYGGRSDLIAGEFWSTGDLGPMEIRGASSAAHIYGKAIVSAEAFTSASRLFGTTPALLKRRGDWAMTEGINHWTLHVSMHQPWNDRKPGMQTWFGTEFNRHNTWFEKGRNWITYFRRAQALLQQGLHVADLALLIPEDAPRMDGSSRAIVPPGFDFDFMNAEVLLGKLQVREGRWVLPDGKSYRVLHLPESDTMRPELLRRIAELVQRGGTLVGTPPTRSPSLSKYGKADEEVRQLARELWGTPAAKSTGSHAYGQGRVFWGMPLSGVFEALGLLPDVKGLDPDAIRWTHRKAGEDEIYFVANQTDLGLTVYPEFRVEGKSPELWYPATGRRVPTAAYESLPKATRMRLFLNPTESVLVVFRGRKPATRSVVALSKDGVWEARAEVPKEARFRGNGEYSDSPEFTMMGWVRPRIDTAFPPDLRWEEVNEVTPIRPGHRVTEPPGTAFATLSAGRNGVLVLATGGSVLEPILAHRAKIGDWTHVALTAKDGHLTLYLDGRSVAEGSTGRYSLRSIASVEGAQRSLAFSGEMTEVTNRDRALSAQEITKEKELTDPRQRPFLPVVDIQQNFDGGATAEVLAGGNYKFKLSDSSEVPIQVSELPDPHPLAEPWTVRFPRENVAAGEITLEKLASLTAHADPQVRFFSGTAVYSTHFPQPPSTPQTRVYLDLGDACGSIGEVTLNGVDLGSRWNPPYVWDVTDRLRDGINNLQVSVTGTWRNRLIGELRDPKAFANTSFRPYLASWGDARLHQGEAMVPSGLLGPVRLVFSRRVSLPAPPKPAGKTAPTAKGKTVQGRGTQGEGIVGPTGQNPRGGRWPSAEGQDEV